MRRFLFRIFYSTSFTFLFLCLIVLVLIPAADAIAQAYLRNKQPYNVFVIAGCYLLTFLLALVIYISRIYTFRRLLADIPKEYVPVRKLDLPKRVHSAIATNLSKSALISASARPRNIHGVWGAVTHPGWAPPGGELQGVQYAAVVSELPTIIETKAAIIVNGNGEEGKLKGGIGNVPSMLVQRRPEMALRSYLDYMAALGLVPRDVIETFLITYERARFRKTGRGIEEMEFRAVMEKFAVLLRAMDLHVHGLEPEIDVLGHDVETAKYARYDYTECSSIEQKNRDGVDGFIGAYSDNDGYNTSPGEGSRCRFQQADIAPFDSIQQVGHQLNIPATPLPRTKSGSYASSVAEHGAGYLDEKRKT